MIAISKQVDNNNFVLERILQSSLGIKKVQMTALVIRTEHAKAANRSIFLISDLARSVNTVVVVQ